VQLHLRIKVFLQHSKSCAVLFCFNIGLYTVDLCKWQISLKTIRFIDLFVSPTTAGNYYIWKYKWHLWFIITCRPL